MPAQKVPQQRKSRIPRGTSLQPVPSALPGPPMEAPPPPKGISQAMKDEWVVFWGSPQAALVVPAHLPALRRLFELRYQRERYAQHVLDDATSVGSTGQLVLSPLVKHLPVLDAAILALEDRFGLTPKSSMSLAGQFDDAHRAAAEANAALASGFEEPEPRRLAAVD